MMTVTPNDTNVQLALRHRPYLRWDLVPLAAYLIEQGYSDGARTWILDRLADGRSPADLVASEDLEPGDLDGAVLALRRGRRQRPSGARRAVRTVGDLLNVVIGSLRACGIDPEEGSVDAHGLDLRVDGHPVRIAIVPAVAGGGPEVTDDPHEPGTDRSVPPDAAIVPPELDPEEEDTGEYPPVVVEPFEPSEEDWAAYRVFSQEIEARRLGLLLPPVSGGAPEPDGPTWEDLEDMHRESEWQDRMEEIGRRERLADEVRRRYGR